MDERRDSLAHPEPSRAALRQRWLEDGVKILEPLRRRWLRCHLVATGTTCSLVVLTVGLQCTAPSKAPYWGSMALLALFSSLLFAHRSNARGEEMGRAFEDWREGVIRFLDARASLDPESGLHPSSFEESWLGNGRYNTCHGRNHLVVGDLRCSQLTLEYTSTEHRFEAPPSHDAGSEAWASGVERTETVVEPVFDGLFLVIPAPLSLPGTVILNPEPPAEYRDLDLIRVASPDLNKTYGIWASDPLVGHSVLTPTLMEALWRFRNGFESVPVFSYRNHELYIAIPSHALRFGNAPEKWFAITLGTLQTVMLECEDSLSFLKSAAQTLVPNPSRLG